MGSSLEVSSRPAAGGAAWPGLASLPLPWARLRPGARRPCKQESPTESQIFGHVPFKNLWKGPCFQGERGPVVPSAAQPPVSLSATAPVATEPPPLWASGPQVTRASRWVHEDGAEKDGEAGAPLPPRGPRTHLGGTRCLRVVGPEASWEVVRREGTGVGEAEGLGQSRGGGRGFWGATRLGMAARPSPGDRPLRCAGITPPGLSKQTRCLGPGPGARAASEEPEPGCRGPARRPGGAHHCWLAAGWSASALPTASPSSWPTWPAGIPTSWG